MSSVKPVAPTRLLQVAGNGSCLFLSMRLGYETLGILKLLETGAHTPAHAALIEHNFFGHGRNIQQEANALRALVCRWYDARKLDLPVLYDQEAPLSRRAVLTAELMRTSAPDESTPDTISDHDAVLYTAEMSKPNKWGSMPEIIAFAMMAFCEVLVWQQTEVAGPKEAPNGQNGANGTPNGVPNGPNGPPLAIVDRVAHKDAKTKWGAPNGHHTVNLLFSGNHYDLLLDEAVYTKLVAVYPFLEHRFCSPYVAAPAAPAGSGTGFGTERFKTYQEERRKLFEGRSRGSVVTAAGDAGTSGAATAATAEEPCGRPCAECGTIDNIRTNTTLCQDCM